MTQMSTRAVHPRPHQVDALTDLARSFALHDRVQLVMACGTGKTLVGRWHAQAAEAQRALVLVPSLALLAQTLGEWRRAGGWPFEALVVCSDPTTSAGAAERAEDDTVGDWPSWAQVRAKVTTSPRVAADFLGRDTSHPLVVFSTYHSAPVVAAAQALTGAVFDLQVCDEAHRLTGQPREEFRVALDRRAVVSRKRLFMTATPRVCDGEDTVSMDDPRTFGPRAHTVSFGAAIDAGLLVDYQVLVIARRAGDTATDERGPQTLTGAVLDAADRHHVTKVLSFHGRNAKAADFAATLNGETSSRGRRILGRHVHGGTPAGERASAMAWLGADTGGGEIRLVSSVRCLSEGVDVPAADGVLFADQRTNVVDIIQAVGRVLRPAPGKTRGTVIVPVSLPEDGDDDTTLTTSAFSHVWTVLRGLRAHDQRLAEELDTATRYYAATGKRLVRGTGRVRFLLPDGVDLPEVELRMVQETGSRWEYFHAVLADWAAEHHGRPLPWNASWRGHDIGKWAENQRTAHRSGLLTVDRARRLERIPGWAWDRADGLWRHTHTILLGVAKRHGLHQDPDGPSIFQGRKDAANLPLGNWVANQRQEHRDGMLREDRAAELEAVPGWTWDGGLPADDVAMVQALRVFCEFERHADVPETHAEDGLPLGRWVWAVRRRKLTGRLHPTLAEEIAAATPRGRKGEPTFRWETAETRWRWAYSALRSYLAREGHASPPTSHREELPDGTVNLGQWASVQRHKHRKGELDERYAGWLEALPGWKWDVPIATVEYGEPLDLGGHRHGTAKGIAAGCTCRDCLDARRAYDREWLARRREIPGGVPARKARAHLDRLVAAGAKKTAIAKVSGVPGGVLRGIGTGKRDTIRREHEAGLLATTTDMCAALDDRDGSRGRSTTTANEVVDAGPTHKILDDLEKRGFRHMWIARELGYAGGMQIRRDIITRRIADAVADLAERIGDLRAPQLPRRQAIPPLVELLRAAKAGRQEREAS